MKRDPNFGVTLGFGVAPVTVHIPLSRYDVHTPGKRMCSNVYDPAAWNLVGYSYVRLLIRKLSLKLVGYLYVRTFHT